MFTLTCSCGAHLIFPLVKDRENEVLCPLCLETYFVRVSTEPQG